jgi:hypothetical protein
MIRVIVTCANIPLQLETRNTEYRLSLAKLLHYGYATYAVISECSDMRLQNTVFKYSKFTYTHCIDNTARLGAVGKSQQETFSIRDLIHQTVTQSFSDDDWIIKVSGRYLFVDDSFVRYIETNPDTDVVYKRSDANQAFTFCFAMRWKYFKQLYSVYSCQMGSKNIETVIVEYVKTNSLRAYEIEHLGIYTNINNDNHYAIY